MTITILLMVLTVFATVGFQTLYTRLPDISESLRNLRRSFKVVAEDGSYRVIMVLDDASLRLKLQKLKYMFLWLTEDEAWFFSEENVNSTVDTILEQKGKKKVKVPDSKKMKVIALSMIEEAKVIFSPTLFSYWENSNLMQDEDK